MNIFSKQARPTYINGVKYIAMDQLPIDQTSGFQSWVESFSGASQKLRSYSDYEYWYQVHYSCQKDLDNLL